MSTQTINYNLVKPSEDEEYDIGVNNGNLDKIDEKIHGVESSLGDVSNYSFGVKSDINLTSEDVILQEVDYCKGLIVIATAHNTNALILPNTDNHKYTIYNADENTPALIKKPSGQPIEIEPKTMVMVGYDGVDYRMIAGGGASDATRFKPVSIDEAVSDLTVVGWDKDVGKWRAVQNGYALYYAGHLYGNGSRVPITGFEADDGLVAFVDTDGTLTSDATKVRAGYMVENGSNLLLDLKGDLGIAKEYTSNMQTAYAVIGKSQTCRVKSEMPSDADGYFLCWKETEWVEGDDENTGTRVGDFTENFIGNNIWYTVEGIQNNTTYYLKWFPYKGNVVNRAIGENEDSIYTQSILADWTFDNVVANTIKDNTGAHDLTNYSVPMSAYKVGNGIERPYGTTQYLQTGRFTPNEFTVVLFFNTSSFGVSDKGVAIIGECNSSEGWAICSYYGEARLKIYAGDDTTYDLTPINYTLSVNTHYFIGITINKSAHTAKLFVNGIWVKTVTGLRTMNTGSTVLHVGKLGHNANMSPYGFKADQMKVIEGEMTQKNFAKLYNGGVGC